jgi:PAS domain S-box-containing protein
MGSNSVFGHLTINSTTLLFSLPFSAKFTLETGSRKADAKDQIMDTNESPKLKALSEISSIDIALDFNEILRKILKITCEAMSAHSGTIMLVDESNEELRMVASHGLPDDYIERVYDAARKANMPISSSASGTALTTRKYCSVPNVFKEPKNRPWIHLARELGFSAQIFTPMKRGQKVIGLLNVYMTDPHQFMDEEINFVTIAASQASSVVQNARICNRLRENVLELNKYKEHLEERINETHKKLYNSERYLRAIIESSLDGIAVVDEQGRFEFGNDSLFDIIGWPEEEIIGQSFQKIVPEDMIDFMQERWRDVQNGIEIPYQTKILTKDGEIKYLYLSPAKAEIDGKIKFIGISKDISENKKLELNLKESEFRYRDLFENADDPMYTIDIEGYFKEINNAGLDILGGSEAEIIGSHISKWLSPESFAAAQVLLTKQISGESWNHPIILEVICKNGEHKWGEVRTRVISKGGRVTAIHGIARDITEKRNMEQKLREYNEKLKKSYESLKEAERIKTEFISNITHELFTPLTSIKGFAELLYDGTVGDINDQQKKSLEAILRNSDRLIRLIKELLDTSYLEKNKLGLQFGLVSMSEIISRCILDIRPRAKDKEISIILDMQPLPKVWGDEEKLTQLIMNLLTNAIKFTPQKGKVRISTFDDTKGVNISVADTGVGIPSDKLNQIFDRFYQVDGSNSRKYGGVGLGLSICRSIIEKHFGSIWAESNSSGSTFHVTLPKLSESKKEQPEG